MTAAELGAKARNIADTAHDAACNGPAEGYPLTLAAVSIAYALLAALEHLGELSEAAQLAERSADRLAEQTEILAQSVERISGELEGAINAGH